jgi:2'-5' RNA ligase
MGSQPEQIERWRVFVAAPVTPPVRRVMQEVQNMLAPRRWPVRWVDPKLAHITLRFFGDVPRAALPALQHELEGIAAGHAALRLRTAGVGAFPSPTRVRVLWLGLTGQVAQLAALARAAEELGEHERTDPRKRPFKAHVTLGRLRDGADPPADFREATAALDLPVVDLPIDRIELIRSVLGPKGPTYTTVATVVLGAPHAVAATSPAPELREHG